MARNHDFERRLVDHPDDRETWTVYADWMESQGDPRGQLLALELRHAKMKSDYKLGALVSAVQSRVMPPLVGELEAHIGAKVVCRHGFIDDVTIAPTHLREVYDHPLSGLLRTLTLRDANSNGADAIALLGQRAPRALRYLRLHLDLELAGLEPLYSLANLEHLVCSEIRDGSAALRSIGAAPWPLRKLELSIRAEEVTSDAIALLLGRDDVLLEQLEIEVPGRDRDPEQDLAGAIARALVYSPSAASLERLTIRAPLGREDYGLLVKHVHRFKRLRDVQLPSRTYTQKLRGALGPQRDAHNRKLREH